MFCILIFTTASAMKRVEWKNGTCAYTAEKTRRCEATYKFLARQMEHAAASAEGRSAGKAAAGVAAPQSRRPRARCPRTGAASAAGASRHRGPRNRQRWLHTSRQIEANQEKARTLPWSWYVILVPELSYFSYGAYGVYGAYFAYSAYFAYGAYVKHIQHFHHI
jgi:hypothetical protein